MAVDRLTQPGGTRSGHFCFKELSLILSVTIIIITVNIKFFSFIVHSILLKRLFSLPEFSALFSSSFRLYHLQYFCMCGFELLCRRNCFIIIHVIV